jgi:hypothetical protein
VTAVAVLTEALARGGRVVWEPPDKPRLLAPPSLHDAIKADRETVKEILRRAAILRKAATTHGPCPILALPEHPGGGGCLSCGDPVTGGHFRCPLCALAVALALEGRP